MKWVAAYTRSRIFNSEEDRWKDLPAKGVIAVKYEGNIYADLGWYRLDVDGFRAFARGPRPDGLPVNIKKGCDAGEQLVQRAVNNLLDGKTTGP